MGKKKSKFANKALKEHPYESGYEVIRQAFDTLLQETEDNRIVLLGYKGVEKIAFEQLNYESDRILEIKYLVLNLYAEHLKIKNELVTKFKKTSKMQE